MQQKRQKVITLQVMFFFAVAVWDKNDLLNICKMEV